MKVGIVYSSRGNHNGAKAVAEGTYEYLGSDRATLIGPVHPRAEDKDGIWLPSRCYSEKDDYFDILLCRPDIAMALEDAFRHVDIVHCNSVTLLTTEAMKTLRRMRNRPAIVHHVHTHWVAYNQERLHPAISAITIPTMTRLYRLHAKMADLIIFPSEWARRVLGPMMGLADDDPRVVVWAAPVIEFGCGEENPQVYDEIRNETMDPNTPFLYFAGRLAKEKKLHEMIHRFRWIHNVNNDKLALVISGFGDQAPYRETARDLGLEKCVFFTGPVSEGTVSALSRKATAGISHCLNETQAMGALRQMKEDKLLIAARGTVFDDDYEASGGVLLFDPNSEIPSVAERLRFDSVLNDPAICATMGQNAGCFARENFNPERQYAALDQLYSRVLNG